MAGVPQSSMAKALKIDEKTLRKHYREELDFGRDLLVAKLTKTAAQKALMGDNTMLCFLLKTRGGFHETARLEHSGRDGKPIAIEGHTSRYDFSKFSPELQDELFEAMINEEDSPEQEADLEDGEEEETD